MAIPIRSHLHLVNDSTPEGDGWWSWSIWVEGPEDELATIEEVTYRLHPTFPKPVVTVADAATKFRLDGSGWGEFSVVAEVAVKAGEPIRLERWLTLEGDTREGADARRPSVFISHSIVDGALVQQLSKALDDEGIDVVTETAILEGDDPFVSVRRRMEAADMVLAVISDPPSPFIERETEAALKSDKLLPIVVGNAEVPRPLTRIARLHFEQPDNIIGLANTIASRVKDRVTPDES